MADDNIFGGDQQTTAADADELAMGTGGSFFNITWLNFKKLFSGLWFGGVEVVSSKSYGIDIGSSSDGVYSKYGDWVTAGQLRGGVSAMFGGNSAPSTSISGQILVLNTYGSTSSAVQLGGGNAMVVKSEFNAVAGQQLINTPMTLTDTGVMTVTGSYSPFTGVHLSKSNEDLKLGELVSLNSYGKITSEKQPDWLAEYCSADKKGNFGIVYDINEIKAVAYSAAKEDKPEILASEAYTQYLIACVGDAGGLAGIQVTNENGNLECGDYLIPSDKKGFAKKYTGDYVPLNHCGKIGEDVVFAENETERIGCAWVKE